MKAGDTVWCVEVRRDGPVLHELAARPGTGPTRCVLQLPQRSAVIHADIRPTGNIAWGVLVLGVDRAEVINRYVAKCSAASERAAADLEQARFNHAHAQDWAKEQL